MASLAGDLADARRGEELAAASSWHVIEQRGGGLGERICHALHETHRLTGGPVVLVGMDTPHLQARVLAEVAQTVAATGLPVRAPPPTAGGGSWRPPTRGRRTDWPTCRCLGRIPTTAPMRPYAAGPAGWRPRR